VKRAMLDLRVADVAVIVLIFVLALAGFVTAWGWGPFAPPPEVAKRTVVIRADGREVLSMPLTGVGETQRHEVGGPLGNTIVESAPDSARVVDSPCRDKLCILHGRISLPGRAAVCLPNRVAVEIVAGAEQPFDALSR
jgi:hypothetical protein